MGKTAVHVALFKKYDVIIIAAAFVAAAMGFVFNFLRPAGQYIEIAVDGNVVHTMPLAVDGRYELDGNIVVVQDGAARMEWADCPDKICVHHREVSKKGETIVCLPNRVTVTVMGGCSDIDGVSK